VGTGVVSEPNPLRARGSLVNALSSALDRGNHGLENVPGLLKRILADESWREFETARGEHVTHDRFESFVSEPPLRGLGATTAVIDRIIGTGDPDLLRMLREARKVGPGHRSDLRPPIESIGGSLNSGRADAAADRLARDAPEEYAAVQRGEKSINAAAISAGIRRRRIAVRLDSAESAAETLRKHMPPAEIARLRDLLAESSAPAVG
jgi:hypothetical protein